MPYLKLTNGAPETYSIGQLRRDNPQVSFPKNPSDSLLADWDVYSYTVNERPTYESLTQRCEAAPFEQIEGVWVQDWVVEQQPLADAERNIRDRRDVLLSQCDWTQVADAPVDQATWAAYRQSLRNVPQQAGFPYNVTWPTKPE